MSVSTKSLTYYIHNTGEIVANLVGQPQESLASFAYIDGLFPAATFYVSGGVAHERQELPLIISGLNITGLPVNTKVTINGEPFMVNDGSVEIVRAGGAPVSVCVEHINYLKTEHTL